MSKALGLLHKGWDVHVICGRSEPADWAYFPELETAGMRARVHVTAPIRPPWRFALQVPVETMQLAARPEVWKALCSDTVPVITRLKRAYLDTLLFRLQPDLVHFEFGALAVKRMYVKEAIGCRVVVSFRGHDISFVKLEQPGFYDELWRKVDALHFLGTDLWQRALDRGCPPDVPHFFIPAAIDISFFDPAKEIGTALDTTTDEVLNIVSIGRMAWAKGHEYAMQAVRHLVDNGISCRYTIIGDGDFVEAVAFARHQLGLEEMVHLTGPLPREQVRAHLARADLFLHAAVSEGFCNAVLEAQAMQLPIVTSDAEGLSENVASGESGFVVPRRESTALAEKMAMLARDPDLRRQMGEAGRQRVLRHFRLADQVEAFDMLYRSMLTGEDGSILKRVDAGNTCPEVAP